MSNSQQKVIVVGAGIIGLMTALELVEQGLQVQIFDQGYAARESSWAGGGILSPMYPWKYHPAINQLAQYGKDSYSQWNKKLLPITGIDFEIEPTGMLIFDESQFEVGLKYAQKFNEPQQQAKKLNRSEIHFYNPRVNSQIQQAIYFPYLANIRNPRLTQSIYQYLSQHKNVEIFEHQAISSFITQGDRVTAVLDCQQKKHYADQFVIASGAWSETLLAQFELSLNIQPIHGQMILFKAPAAWLPTMCMLDTMYLIPRRDGHIVCGSSTNTFGFNKQLEHTITQNIKDYAFHLVPELKEMPLVQQWAGLRPGSDNGVPKISKIPQMQNIWLNVGHYRNGLVMAPASAKLLRQLMLGQTPLIDNLAYSL